MFGSQRFVKFLNFLSLL